MKWPAVLPVWMYVPSNVSFPCERTLKVENKRERKDKHYRAWRKLMAIQEAREAMKR